MIPTGAATEKVRPIGAEGAKRHDILVLCMDQWQTHMQVQRLGWFEQRWDVTMPENFADDYKTQPPAVRHYKETIDLNYGRIPDDRPDLWLKHRNYLLNCMRLVDAELSRLLEALDRLGLWHNTVVVFTGDHGEMNGAHRMTQKGAIPFDEAAVVNLTVCAPGGPQGKRTAAVGSHLDLAPTLLAFAGLGEEEIRKRYPHLKGRSLKAAITDPSQDGPRAVSTLRGTGRSCVGTASVCSTRTGPSPARSRNSAT